MWVEQVELSEKLGTPLFERKTLLSTYINFLFCCKGRVLKQFSGGQEAEVFSDNWASNSMRRF